MIASYLLLGYQRYILIKKQGPCFNFLILKESSLVKPLMCRQVQDVKLSDWLYYNLYLRGHKHVDFKHFCLRDYMTCPIHNQYLISLCIRFNSFSCKLSAAFEFTDLSA